MILSDDIAESAISLKDQYFDLKGLEAYSALKVPTLRDYIKSEIYHVSSLKAKS